MKRDNSTNRRICAEVSIAGRGGRVAVVLIVLIVVIVMTVVIVTVHRNTFSNNYNYHNNYNPNNLYNFSASSYCAIPQTTGVSDIEVACIL